MYVYWHHDVTYVISCTAMYVMSLDCALQVGSAMKTALMAGTEIVGGKDQTCARYVSVTVL